MNCIPIKIETSKMGVSFAIIANDFVPHACKVQWLDPSACHHPVTLKSIICAGLDVTAAPCISANRAPDFSVVDYC
jgi:hypothetical protein